jgi:hypothetical protein
MDLRNHLAHDEREIKEYRARRTIVSLFPIMRTDVLSALEDLGMRP